MSFQLYEGSLYLPLITPFKHERQAGRKHLTDRGKSQVAIMMIGSKAIATCEGMKKELSIPPFFRRVTATTPLDVVIKRL